MNFIPLSKPLSVDTPVTLRLSVFTKDIIDLWPDDNNPDYQENEDGTTDAPLEDKLYPPLDQDVCSYFAIDAETENGTSLVDCNGWYINEVSEDYLGDRSMLLYADDEAADPAAAFSVLQKWKKYVSEEDEKDPFFFPCCIYLHRLFVNPDYRQKNLAYIILKNLDTLFEKKYTQSPRYAVTIVNPDEPADGMTKKQMAAIMMKTLRKAGFVKIGTLSDDEPLPVFAKRYRP